MHISTEGICEKLNACGLRKRECKREEKNTRVPMHKIIGLNYKDSDQSAF